MLVRKDQEWHEVQDPGKETSPYDKPLEALSVKVLLYLREPGKFVFILQCAFYWHSIFLQPPHLLSRAPSSLRPGKQRLPRRPRRHEGITPNGLNTELQPQGLIMFLNFILRLKLRFLLSTINCINLNLSYSSLYFTETVLYGHVRSWINLINTGFDPNYLPAKLFIVLFLLSFSSL